MTVISYHSTLIPKSSSSPPRCSPGPAGTTSCQILLSRGVSDVFAPLRTHAATEAPQSTPASVFESSTHHIMTLGGSAVGTAPPDSSPMADFRGVLEHVARRPSPLEKALDGSMTNLHTPPIEISTPGIPHTGHDSQPMRYPDSISELDTPMWTLTSADSFEPEPPRTDKGKGKEVDRGRTSDRNYRAANPSVRAESYPRRLEPSFELISQPSPIRPLPIPKRSGNLSRSSTFHNDPLDQCAALDDQILEQCPDTPICPLTEVLNSPAEFFEKEYFNKGLLAEETKIDTPNPLTGLFRSDSNCLYEMKITRFKDTSPWQASVSNEHRKTPSPPPTLSPEVLSKVPSIPHLEYLASMSSKEPPSSPYEISEDINTPIPSVRIETLPILRQNISLMASLPVEIIQQIYLHLGPSDFNATRRVNRKWFISSLHKALLQKMLKRGGWSRCLDTDLTENSVIDEINKVKVNDEWIMSKKVSRECALGPDWTGNGLEFLPSPTTFPSMALLGLSLYSERPSLKKTAFKLTSTTDFTEVGIHYPNATAGTGASSAGTVFTVSVCGKFLMVANGCLIYIYELNRSRDPSLDDRTFDPGELKPVTSIICPRRVLACSMDTSSSRYAIAVLLDGRMGLVCDITAPLTTPPRRAGSSWTTTAMGTTNVQAGPSAMGGGYGPTSYRNNVLINSSTSNAFERSVTEKPFVFPIIAAHDSETRNNTPSSIANPSNFQEAAWKDMLKNDVPSSTMKSLSNSPISSGSSSHSNLHLLPTLRTFPTATQTSMPLEYGPRSIYRNLCSDDDPPRSVAICPQRRCVAFGCSAGIELHWVDALTGQDLNRWFPLTAPSDFLFFLPPRKGVDSAKKLRLISSAACPNESPGLAERFRSSSVNADTSSRPFWDLSSGGVGGQGGFGQGVNGMSMRSDDSDHYRAVPLSDGYHILFTNPVTGVLCLGSDAPIGGPTKLLRKIWFMGPKGLERNRPISYAGGSDLKEGVRVVAAYEKGDGKTQGIWLFSVPCDVFRDSQNPGDGRSESEWREWWGGAVGDDDDNGWIHHSSSETSMGTVTNSNKFPSPSFSTNSNWPVQVRGQEIGTCIGLVDLAIHSGPEITVWALTRTGMAMVWQLDHGNPEQGIKRRVVLRDGTIRETDEDGDIEMIDSVLSTPDSLLVELATTPSSLHLPDPMQESFDGAASSYSPPPPYDYETQITHEDGGGDVLMADMLPDVWIRISEFGDAGFAESSELVGDGGAGIGGLERSLYRSTRWGGRFVDEMGGGGADLVEELTGVARMEVEIH